MNTGLISVRYATALIEFAKETHELDHVYEEAKLLTFMFTQLSKLRYVLDNPVLDIQEKRKLIINAAGGKACETFQKFVDLLLQNKRENQLQNIMLKFIDLYRQEKHIRHGRLITASAVDEVTEIRLTKLVASLEGGIIELEKVIDPRIIGGFKLEIDDVRWDASISGELSLIKKEFIERNRRIV